MINEQNNGLYQLKVDEVMLNTMKNYLADVSGVKLSSVLLFLYFYFLFFIFLFIFLL